MKRIIAGAVLVIGFGAMAEVRLPSVFADGMVLQRNATVPVWGFADAGENVAIEFAGQRKAAVADERGRWRVNFDPMPASSIGRTMKIYSSGSLQLEIGDILVGEVWLASGQSNMEFSIVSLPDDEKAEVAASRDNTLFRMFCIPGRMASVLPAEDTVGYWSGCSKIVDMMVNKTIEPFESHSAVAFFFGIQLQRQLGVPVAVMDSSWGGTKIERWIADEGYEMTGLKHRSVSEETYPVVVRHQEKLISRLKEWVPQAEAAMQRGQVLPLPGEARVQKEVTNDIYNGMIHPLVPFALKGVLWYQGESDRGVPDYFERLEALIGGWAKVFNRRPIPFFLVQIAPFDYSRGRDSTPSSLLADSIWAAQYKAAAEIDGCEIVPVYDTIKKDVSNIHPPGKKTVGYRLAAMALNKTYGENVICSGPRFDSALLSGSTVLVQFAGIEQGLVTGDGQPPSWFEIAGEDMQFVPARAEIRDRSCVAVSSPEIVRPEYIRMGWYDTAVPNLMDGNGWPVFAFPAQPVE